MVSTKPVLPKDRGPFSGHPLGYITLERKSHGRSNGFVASPESQKVLETIRKYRAVSKVQLSTLCQMSQTAIRNHLKRLWQFGFIDRLYLQDTSTTLTSTLYIIGPEGNYLFREHYEEWSVLRALRLAAANQLHVRFLKIYGDKIGFKIEPHLGVNASFRLNNKEFGVLAPRLWPGELDWCVDMATVLPSKRLIIVAGAASQAHELARIIPPVIPMRFTWDTLLENGLSFMRREGNRLIEAEDLTLSLGSAHPEQSEKRGSSLAN